MSDDTRRVIAEIKLMHSEVLAALEEVRHEVRLLKDRLEAAEGIVVDPLDQPTTERTGHPADVVTRPLRPANRAR